MKTFIICGTVLLGACAPLKVIESPVHIPLSRAEFLKDQNLREKSLSSVEGKLQVRYSLQRNSFSGEARLIKTAQLSRFEVRDPMGRVRYWLIGDPMGVLAFYETDHAAYSAGQGGENYFQQFFGMKLTWEELEDLWMGVLPKFWRDRMSETWISESGFYRGEIRPEKNPPVVFEVSAKTRQLNRLQFKQNKTAIEIVFSDFDACCAQGSTQSILGHSVEIKITDSDEKDEKIELEWDELNILGHTPNPAAFDRKLPSGVKITNLDKERKRP